MNEMWKTIPGYDGRYEVSDKGKVRSHYGRSVRILKSMRNAGKGNGYEMVTLYDKSKRGKKVKVHRLVAEAFIPNPHALPVINHKDENKVNNAANNLEWCTVLYNNTYGTARQRAVETLKKGRLERCQGTVPTTPRASRARRPRKKLS